MATENEQLLEEQARLREKEDRKFMRQALTQAKKAATIDEVPIGCVIVCDGKVIARGYNRRGAMNAKAGCAGSIINLLDMQQFNHQIPITKGVLEQECSQILSEFFKRIRVKKKKRPLTNEEISDTIMDAQPGR